MKLWLLKAPDDLPTGSPFARYDVATGFVVRAETELAARRFAHENGGDENSHGRPWMDDTVTQCREITADGKVGVILRDFAAG